MIKILMLILVGFVVYSMVSGLRRPTLKKPQNRSRDGERMVEDLQCGTFLPLSDAISATIKGRERYFCSKKCLREYKKNQ